MKKVITLYALLISINTFGQTDKVWNSLVIQKFDFRGKGLNEYPSIGEINSNRGVTFININDSAAVLTPVFKLIGESEKEVVITTDKRQKVYGSVLKILISKRSKIPKEIGLIKNLTKLNLQGSCIKSIPKEIGQINSLAYLNLVNSNINLSSVFVAFRDFNKPITITTNEKEKPIDGTLHIVISPNIAISKKIGLLKNLIKLNLEDSKIEKLPKKIGRLNKLSYLNIINDEIDLASAFIALKKIKKDIIITTDKLKKPNDSTLIVVLSVNITNIPKQIGLLKNVIRLNLSESKIDEIPNEVAKLSKLTSLNLTSTPFKEISNDILRLPKLKYLSLAYCRSFDIPKLLNQLKTLNERIIINSYYHTNKKHISVSLSFKDSIPDNICELNSLIALRVGCEIKYIPDDITRLTNLEELDLSFGKLTNFPVKILKLNNLKSLWLYGNNLEKLPAEINLLKNLRTLNVSHNKLKEIPSQIGALDSLRILELNKNNLESLPKEICNLKSLEKLNIEQNKLKVVPVELGNLQKLMNLTLGKNLLSNIPKEIELLSQLEFLDLQANKFDSLPEQICNLSKLKNLNVSSNNLSFLPKSIGRLKNLESINFGNNKIYEIPKSIKDLANLKNLYAYNNKLINIPKGISSLSNLIYINLEDNTDLNLYELREVLQDFTKEYIIKKRDSYVDDTNLYVVLSKRHTKLFKYDKSLIPLNNSIELPKDHSLERLSFKDQNIVTIPKEILKFKNLSYLNLQENSYLNLDSVINILKEFDKDLVLFNTLEYYTKNKDNKLLVALPKNVTLPKSIGLLQQLVELKIADCKLETLPKEIGKLKNLTVLNFEKNRLEQVPEEIGNLESLKELDLSDNRIKILPESISKLQNLKQLKIQKNQINEIQKEICKLEKIEELWLSNNDIKSLPESIVMLKSLKFLIISSNKLEKLPSFITNLDSLINISCGFNKLTILPDNIWEMKNLTHLGLDGNLLKSIPVNSNLKSKLKTIELTRNNFEEIPKELIEFNNLYFIDLRNNEDLNVESLIEFKKQTKKKVTFAYWDNFFKRKQDQLEIRLSSEKYDELMKK